MSKLKPCPFCGGNNVRILQHRVRGAINTWSVCCDDCKFGSVANLNKGALIEHWNTRADLDKVESNLDKVLDKIVSELEELQGMYNCAEKMYNIADILDMAIEIVRNVGVSE